MRTTSLSTTSPGMWMQDGDRDAREVGLGLLFRYGMEAGTIVGDKIVGATRSRDDGAMTWWQAVAEAVDQATRPPSRHAHAA